MARLLCLIWICQLLGGAAQAACTNYGRLAVFDARKHAAKGPDLDDGKAITRLVVETEAGLLPVGISSPKDAERLYSATGTGGPMPMQVSIDANACKKGSRRLFTPKYYRKLPLDPPFPFASPLASLSSAATVEALARTILAATHCRGGEIKLGKAFTYIDERGATPRKRTAPALNLLGPGYGDTVWGVRMTCSLWRER